CSRGDAGCDTALLPFSSHVSKKLWLNKYAPRRFTDLVSSASTNKRVLSWIKQWDACVFGKKHAQHTMRRSDHFEEKIMLISGPPGLGKTTLAHIAARQAGYDVLEINASDDRTGTVLQAKLRAALETHSVKQSGRPTLVIIDEIDGKKGAHTRDGHRMRANRHLCLQPILHTGKRTRRQPLLRPIICICNDQFAPALRPLRMVANLLQVEPVAVNSLVMRLKEICTLEKLQAENRALVMLAETTNCDLRTCVNTLQLLSTTQRTVTLDAVHHQSVDGGKDIRREIFHVWSALFQRPNAKRQAARSAKGTRADLFRRYTGRLSGLVNASGDYERIMYGCFENYLRVRYHDHALRKPNIMSEWFHWFESMNHGIVAQHRNELYAYLAYPAVAVHPLFAGSMYQRIEYPKPFYEVSIYMRHVEQKNHDSLVRQLSTDLPVHSRRLFSRKLVGTELLPHLLRIISPEIRSVNAQLIRANERAIVQRVVDLMTSFRVNYIQERREDGQFFYRLEPYVSTLDEAVP
ncbi:P-loop containing nucleoside triphosphate hydrolase protein, partial [Thamnocephalis sphaerospora]